MDIYVHDTYVSIWGIPVWPPSAWMVGGIVLAFVLVGGAVFTLVRRNRRETEA